MKSKRSYLASSSFKMALLFTSLASAAVLSLGYFLYDFGREGYERESEAAIDSEISSILMEANLDSGRSMVEIVADRVGLDRGIHYLLADLEGEPLAGDLSGFPPEAARISEGVILFQIDSVEGMERKNPFVAAKIHTLENGDQLMVARDISEISRRFERLRLLSMMSIACMMVVILVSFLISLFVVSRINRITDTVWDIMQTGDLSRRLVVDSHWDDLSHLSRVLNTMLDRIEDLVEGIKQVSDNIAHDLRTPLTRLRNRLEGLQAQGATERQIGLLIEEADQILVTFQSLLRISRMNAGKEKSAFAKVDLRTILEDAIELYRPLATEKGIEISFEPVTTNEIKGDRDLLFQALANILDNAIKHGGSGGQITCKMGAEQGSDAWIAIEDTGPGIPDLEKKRVFERFYRTDSSRSTRGSGLGLSMVDAIVSLHGGRIILYDVKPKGLGLRMIIPAGERNITES